MLGPMDALTTTHPILTARLRRLPEAPVDRAAGTVDDALRLTAQLPTLVRGGWGPATPVSLEEAHIRIEAALWEVAERKGVEIDSCTSAGEVADELSARGLITPPARDAVRAIVRLCRDGVDDLQHEVDRCRAAGRLIAYLELRARFG